MATAIQALSAYARRWGVSGCLGVGIAVATASACNADFGQPASPGLGAGSGDGAGGGSSGGAGGGGGGSAGANGGAAGEGGAVVTSFDGPTSFTCNPNLKPAMDQIRALTSRQYLNTVADLIAALTGSSSVGSSVLSDLSITAAQALLEPNTPTIPLPLVDATATSAQNANYFGSSAETVGVKRSERVARRSSRSSHRGIEWASRPRAWCRPPVDATGREGCIVRDVGFLHQQHPTRCSSNLSCAGSSRSPVSST
jgi:hypothetical protein